MTKPTSEYLLNRLIDNALGFAIDAANTVEHNPRQSILSFAATVELILKARLFHEHWTLIVDKPGSKSLSDLESGDFRSVSYKDLPKRLQTVTNESLSKHEVKLFNKIASHRNKCIHFFHPELMDDPVVRIVAEQLAAWFCLHRLLTNRWEDYFSDWSQQIAGVDQALQKNRHYLQGKFDALQPDIEDQQKNGVRFDNCLSCKFASLHVDESESPLIHRKCWVCDAWHDYLLVKCPHCENDVRIEQDDQAACESCKGLIKISDLLDQFTKSVKPGDHDEYAEGIFCMYCVRIDVPTVVPLEDGYLCVSCLEKSSTISACEYCHQDYIGFAADGSGYRGCEICDGHPEWNDDSMF